MPRSRSSRLSSALDTFAVGLSGLCVIHCLLLPVLIALFPLLGALDMATHQTFHQVILIGVIPAAVISLGSGYMRHRARGVVLLGLIGVAALMFAAFVLHAQHAHHLETGVTVVGGFLLALAHVGNLRRCRRGHCVSLPRPEAEEV